MNRKNTMAARWLSARTTSQVYYLPEHDYADIGEPREEFESQLLSPDTLNAIDDE